MIKKATRRFATKSIGRNSNATPEGAVSNRPTRHTLRYAHTPNNIRCYTTQRKTLVFGHNIQKLPIVRNAIHKAGHIAM